MACNSFGLQALRQHLRNQALTRRNKIRTLKKNRLSARIRKNLLPLLLGKPTMAYFPLAQEPDLLACLTPPFYLPRIISRGIMEARQFIPQKLTKNRFGILEPDLSCPTIKPQNLKIILVPALLVDSFGNRLGFGNGYYDRFLKTCPHALKIACVYDWQITHKLPSLEHDIAVDIIITEKRTVLAPDPLLSSKLPD
ncbi:MAG: 5-formyltetrahydrofolate cyclo-ligase [Candidatus Cloacimonetes bacterium]|nr:5-formyltetrahydrofolate cyclo-ligase [Candidatus Cloacimonadota bacterium]